MAGRRWKVKSSDASISLATPGHKFLSNTDNSSAGKPTNVVNNELLVSSGSKANQIKQRTENENVRRSGCLKSLVLPGRTRAVMKPTVEHVILIDNESEKEKEEEETEAEKVDALPVLNEKELGVETQDEQVSVKTNESSSTDFSYKSLYIQTQKKYEALMEEHYDAIKRLEFARGQITAYEKMKNTMGGASRELILVSDLGKLTDGGGATVHKTALNCTLSPSAPDVVVVEADKNPNKNKTHKRKKKVSSVIVVLE